MSSASRVLSSSSCALFLLAASARGQGLRWSTTFDPQNAPTDQVFALHEFDDGTGPALYVGGDFHWAGSGPPVNHIARWDGTAWSRLGSGLGDDLGGAGSVYALASYGQALVVGGYFVRAGGVSTNCIAQWDGTSWSAIGTPWGVQLPGVVASIAVDGSALYIGGGFDFVNGVSACNVAEWDGQRWLALGSGIGVGDFNAGVSALVVFDDGTGSALYAGGTFQNAGGVRARNLAKWDGVAWSPVGVHPFDGVDGWVSCLTVFDDALVVGGQFHDAGGVPAENIAKWDGAQWTPIGAGHADVIRTLTTFDDGTGPAMYAGGFFFPNPEKWDGSRWSALGAGVGPFGNNMVYALSAFGSELYAGGNFTTAGGLPSTRVAGWHALTGPVSTFCFGDDTVAVCPCGNRGIYGRGCENALGSGGAWLATTGSQSPDTIVLHAAGEISSALSIVLQGGDLILGSSAYGDGLRCVGGHMKRLYTRSAVNGRINVPEAGDPSITARSAALGDPIAPGAARCYQVYYRDPNPNYCPAPLGDTFNTTNGLRIVW